MFYPALASMASQYQIYKFLGMKLKYEPSCGTSTAGQVGIAALPSYAAAAEIKTWQDLIALPQTKVTSPWAGLDYSVDLRHLNTQYKEWKSITPCSAIDVDQGDQVQGVVVYAINACDTTDTATVIGRWTVNYTVDFTKPRLDPVLSPTNIYSSVDHASLVLGSGNEHFAEVTAVGTDTDPEFDVSTQHRANLMVWCSGTNSGTCTGQPEVVCVSGCVKAYINRTAGIQSADKHVLALVKSTGETPLQEFTIVLPTTSGVWSDIRIFVRAVGRHDFMMGVGDFS
jgi:hypothetical protein